jgi:hypothetical protein
MIGGGRTWLAVIAIECLLIGYNNWSNAGILIRSRGLDFPKPFCRIWYILFFCEKIWYIQFVGHPEMLIQLLDNNSIVVSSVCMFLSLKFLYNVSGRKVASMF